MINKALEDYTAEDLLVLLNENVDAIVLVDPAINKYRTIASRGIFEKVLDETGDYQELIEKLWFHFSDSDEEIVDDYKAFISYYGEFRGKYSRRLKIYPEGCETPCVIQMNVYPMERIGKYVFAMDILDDEEYYEEFMTTNKIKTIQNTYLFSMFVDLLDDSTSSISVTEISEDTVKSNISYSQWRLVTVNLIWPDSQKQFLKFTNPDFLKENLSIGNTISFDCMMKNLEGTFIWVKLIFSRAQTINDEDFKFVFMVQDINEDVKERLETLKKYEGLVLRDSLTGLLNHGGIKSEIEAAIEDFEDGESNISLMMIDLDNFKSINDTYGHSVGDATLKALSDVLKKFYAEKEAAVGRWGGEEFVAVVKDMTEDETLDYAENLRKTVADVDFGEAGHITCSIGISRFNTNDSFEDVFNRMDKAMYYSKETGKNKVTIL
ncbi:GGDEF domain-containing protein [Butyrivibrio sp. YAB3001]|uniref:GGDEF domain-containing protein n=1 Tax=Butyrivibrio sp. YAB3001 TaxID=1520812 RepID=UPI0008F654EF|nr:GGDEF domain-containing protein [Butyrivibrio sp. YAB3001]SFB74190.1 diguanylate cyclase (GGDEF) domain-containing protein [Butyrivibrio sp. YAB3001]